MTQIEYISHTNKNLRRGRDLYRQKREELQAAGVNIVEIDLLRGGTPVVDVMDSALDGLQPWHYLVNVARGGEEEREVYPLVLRGRLPRVRVPLRPGVQDVVLDIPVGVLHDLRQRPLSRSHRL